MVQSIPNVHHPYSRPVDMTYGGERCSEGLPSLSSELSGRWRLAAASDHGMTWMAPFDTFESALAFAAVIHRGRNGSSARQGSRASRTLHRTIQ